MALQVTPPYPVPFCDCSVESYSGVPALIGLTDGMAEALRTASQKIDSYSPPYSADLAEATITDYGDLTTNIDDSESLAREVGDACQALLVTNSAPVILGTSGLITSGAARATLNRFPELVVVKISAHPDLLNEKDDQRWHERCSLRRVLDRLPPQKLILLGARTGILEELQQAQGKIAALKDSPIYLSLDLSIFDPVFLPAVARPECGGLDLPRVEKLLAQIPWKQVKACDIVGLNPEKSGGHKLVAKLVRDILLNLANRPSN